MRKNHKCLIFWMTYQSAKCLNKYKVDDLLFVEYKCLIKETEIGYWILNNYFDDVVGSKKKWKTRERT